jgi:hypothetical protein
MTNDFDAAAEFRNDEIKTKNFVATSCTLDSDALRDLCTSIIDSAREDLGHQPSPLTAPHPVIEHY